MLQGDVMKHAAGQNDVAGLLWRILQGAFRAIEAAEPRPNGSERALNDVVSGRMGHVVAVLCRRLRDVQRGHQPRPEQEGAVTWKWKGAGQVTHLQSARDFSLVFWYSRYRVNSSSG